MPFSFFPRRGAPRSLPVVGHALAFSEDPLRFITAMAREHGGIAPIKIGPLSGYLVSEPELVGDVLTKKMKHYTRKTRVYGAMTEFLGDGILTTEGEDWRIHRRIVQPAFHKQRLESFAEGIARITHTAFEDWRGDIDVSDAMMRLTLKIVSEVLLGTTTDRDATDIGEAVDGSQRFVEGVMAEVVKVPRAVPTRRNRQFKRSLATLDRVAYSIIDERRRSNERGSDAVSMLLDARYEDGEPLSRLRIRNELVTLLAAGHETTANALSWTLMRLSLHPDVFRRLVAEVDAVVGDRRPTSEDVARLELTRRIFDESMRLHPPVWVTGRRVIEPHELGGRRMQPDMMVMLSPYVTHRRPDLWENPEGFDPDRWLSLSERGALAPFTYYPFGGGTRKCVGEAFAYLEATLILAMFAQRFRLALLSGMPVRPAPQVTLGIEGGLWMSIEPRPVRAEAARATA